MKKLPVLFALALLLWTGSANAAYSGPSLPASVSREFKQQFSSARSVKWETIQSYYKATFDLSGKTLFAFYTNGGELMGVAHNLSPINLPQPLRDAIKTSWSGYWITDLFSYHNPDGHGLVITLENADKIIVLKSNDSGEWTPWHATVKS